MERSIRRPRGVAIDELLDADSTDENKHTARKPRKGDGLREQITASKEERRHVSIDAPKFETALFPIRGLTPLVINAFSQKQKDAIIETQKAGQQARSRRKRAPKDFEAVYRASLHVAAKNGKDPGGWYGFNASAIRNGSIDVCRLVGFKMTIAKMSIFVEADGWDVREGVPLIRILGEPHSHIGPVRNPNTGTIDMAARGMFDAGWRANIRMTWDADQFSASDVANLLHRVGRQCGIGEGRFNSKNSYGVGWGMFEIEQPGGAAKGRRRR